MEKLRTYDEVNAEMQRLQVELDKVQVELDKASERERIEQIRPWVGKVFSYVDSGFTKHFYYTTQITEEGYVDYAQVSLWTDGIILQVNKGGNIWVIVSALDNFEVTEVPLETFKKIVKEEVEAI